jgi:hypothetical protein
MSHPARAGGNGPWRLVVFDRDPADSKLILATVLGPADVQGADVAAPEAIASWVRGVLGHPATLVPLIRPLAWRVEHPPEDSWPISS